MLTEGSLVPAFEAKTSTGQLVASQDWTKPVVLYFYPRDNTPGCTQESCDFAQRHPEFEKLGVTVYGISRDTASSHEKFKLKYNLPFELITDPDEALCLLFDVMVHKNMYGKKVRGIERSTFLINEKGVIQKIWRKVKIEGHVEEVLEALK